MVSYNHQTKSYLQLQLGIDRHVGAI